jgi:hypothetical protein
MIKTYHKIMHLINKILYKFYCFYKKLIGYDHYKWSLALVDKKNLGYRVTYFNSPSGEFWADPFYFKYQNKDFFFFERYCYKNKKGEICCAELRDNKLINIQSVLKKKYHLSFPNIFRYKKNIFLLPETHENKRLEIYICDDFPKKWSLYSTAFIGEIVCDPLILLKNKKLWLFINKTSRNVENLNKDLYIYQIDSLKLKSITPHKKNPVISSLNGGRNASQNFFRNKNMLRVSQDCTNLYGESINISKITKLNINSYTQKLIKTIKPNIFRDCNIIGIHSLFSFKKKYLIDVLYEFKK